MLLYRAMISDMATQTVTAHIAQVVRDSGHTQGHIAQHLGLSRVAVSDRLRGRTRWAVDDVLGLAQLLEVPPADLIEVDE